MPDMFSRILILLPLVALAFADPLADPSGITALRQDFNATDQIVCAFPSAMYAFFLTGLFTFLMNPNPETDRDRRRRKLKALLHPQPDADDVM